MKTAMAAIYATMSFFVFNAGAHVDRLAAECKKATASQIEELNRGNARMDEFLEACADATDNSPWCPQLIKPSSTGLSAFRCTYGSSQVYRFIHPDEATWDHAFKAIRMIQTLQSEKIRVCQIYYWWRPEPFNTNAGGAPTRHPFGTSVDVRFCSMTDMEKAHKRLCAWREQGELRAVGYYNSPELHFGIADRIGNTWGKDCPARPQFSARVVKSRAPWLFFVESLNERAHGPFDGSGHLFTRVTEIGADVVPQLRVD